MSDNYYYYKFDKDAYFVQCDRLKFPIDVEFFKFIKRFEYMARKNLYYFYRFNESDHDEFILKYPKQTLLQKSSQDEIKQTFK